MEPIRFSPLYMERVWGGRELESRYRRRLPADGTPFGEAWEMVDREGEQSVVEGGEFHGLTLGELWTKHRPAVFGDLPGGGRFPLLLKILDARDRLSIQVHPPAEVAPEMGGEPKTEMWYIAAADPGAALYVGLKEGVTRDAFERGIAAGETESQVHRIEVEAGEFIFIPSGRLHAIGAGLLIFEIQQNSDTTYRVFDWNRVGLDGKPRDLHVEESLRCIDFADVEPGMDAARGETLVDCPLFRVERWRLDRGAARASCERGGFAIFSVVDGALRCGSAEFGAGDCFLAPVGGRCELAAGAAGATVLRTTLPPGA